MGTTQKTFIKEFTKAIKQGTAAVFAGAGLSIPAGYVNWKDLLREIADELDLNIDKEHDLIGVAQYYVNEHDGNRNKLSETILNEFTKEASLTENHKLLSRLPINTYWTTNYDKNIEKALNQAGKSVDAKLAQEDLSTTKQSRDAVVYKMHGDVSQASKAVLTKDDYESYNEKRQLFTTALQGDLISKTFMFIGFSFDDPNLEQILSRIRLLLGQNQRNHYCFFKAVNKSDFKDPKKTDVQIEEDFLYAKIKFDLKVKDLKRYSINAVIVKEYHEITDILKVLNFKIKLQNVFISGAAHTYGEWQENEGLSLIRRLAYKLADNNYRIISGYGLGIGSEVINGVLEKVYSGKNRHKLDQSLILRPFPQSIPDATERAKLWTKYRQDMLSEAGIAIFLFGNKLEKGKVVPSSGMQEEFEIAVQNQIKVIPIGCTGFISKDLWSQVLENWSEYYPEEENLQGKFASLGEDYTQNPDRLIDHILDIIKFLQ